MFDSSVPRQFLDACPAYKEIPLHEVQVNGRETFLKDESNRMGLGSFNALDGVHAVARLLAAQLGEPLAFETLHSDRARKVAQGLTFVCASAGNHGLAVAVGASVFGARARIYLSKDVQENFAERSTQKGADVRIAGNNYEESLAAAQNDECRNGHPPLARLHRRRLLTER